MVRRCRQYYASVLQQIHQNMENMTTAKLVGHLEQTDSCPVGNQTMELLDNISSESSIVDCSCDLQTAPCVKI